MVNYNTIITRKTITICQFHSKSSFFGLGQFLCDFEVLLVPVLFSRCMCGFWSAFDEVPASISVSSLFRFLFGSWLSPKYLFIFCASFDSTYPVPGLFPITFVDVDVPFLIWVTVVVWASIVWIADSISQGRCLHLLFGCLHYSLPYLSSYWSLFPSLYYSSAVRVD